ncbi:hypothetical protein MES5069_230018 [Mesorhizobium escarrei]|uniref:Uncharacterized protein n=1 Tax=Mesorhizobium escarrei TaxID=666018 RepID=A0ABM9DSA6_9HYPH|nr:hypothetical protein MES5069_230018 [Mesorhizobium escarrei]
MISVGNTMVWEGCWLIGLSGASLLGCLIDGPLSPSVQERTLDHVRSLVGWLGHYPPQDKRERSTC